MEERRQSPVRSGAKTFAPAFGDDNVGMLVLDRLETMRAELTETKVKQRSTNERGGGDELVIVGRM